MPLPQPPDIQQDLQQRLPGVEVTVEGSALIVNPESLLKVCHFFKENEPYRLDYLSNLCGVDYLGAQPRLETVYHLYSMEKKHGPVMLKVRVPRDNPRQPSVVSVWRGAEFQEREAYDLYGIIYDGHPDLRRILMWDEFVGHPMRKDYVQEDQDALDQPPATRAAQS